MSVFGPASDLFAIGVPRSSLLALGQAGGAESGGISGVALWVGLLVLLVILLAIIIKAFGQRRAGYKALEEEPEAEALPAPEEEAERRPSLREIKEARAQKLTTERGDKDALLKARQARKGASRAVVQEAEEEFREAEAEEPAQRTPAVEATAAPEPAAPAEAPAGPQTAVAPTPDTLPVPPPAIAFEPGPEVEKEPPKPEVEKQPEPPGPEVEQEREPRPGIEKQREIPKPEIEKPKRPDVDKKVEPRKPEVDKKVEPRRPEVDKKVEPRRPEVEKKVEPRRPEVEKKVEPRRPEVEKHPEPKSLRDGLAKTRSGFFGRLRGIFAREKAIDDTLMGELEEVLLTADIGVKTSMKLLEAVERKVAENGAVDAEQVWDSMRAETAQILRASQRRLVIGAARPFVILVIGVNGTGKTTTVGKLASRFKSEGHKVLLVAGDTFRAAAIDQLKIWGTRTGCEVFAGDEGADPSGVVFDGVKRAVEGNMDVVLIDTAGRLHTKVNLVEELKKVRRVCGKAHPGAPHEVLLVLDANTGQNAINQAEMFGKEVDVTGIALTKLDGTAKGGVVIGICDELGVPVQFIGIGEQVEDLREFDADEFVDAVF
jgi:fused signal recognition particle receptor